jgi:hypothetical protein
MIDARIDDRTIDAIARSMTAGAGPDDLAARVLAALPAKRPARTWHPWRLAIAGVSVTAAAIVLLASSVTVVLPTLEPGSIAAGPALATAIPSSAQIDDVIAPSRATRAAVEPHREPTPGIYRLPALAQPDALDVAPIQPANVAIALLELKPMATEPLAIPRVDPRGGSR